MSPENTEYPEGSLEDLLQRALKQAAQERSNIDSRGHSLTAEELTRRKSLRIAERLIDVAMGGLAGDDDTERGS
ncbi:MAG TPA: hypothetical protein VIQ24_04990 [Pyrinomonadaceae bacterium]